MVESSSQVSVGNLFHAEFVQRFQVNSFLRLLKFRDGDRSMVYRQKPNEKFEISNFLVRDFSGGLQVQDLIFFLSFRFEKGFQGGLTLSHLLLLLSVLFLLLLSREERFHHTLSSLNAIVHTLHIQEFSFYPDIRISVWVLSFHEVLLHFVFKVLAIWMSQDSLVVVLVRVVSDSDVFVLHKLEHEFILVLVVLVSSLHLALQNSLLVFHYCDHSLQELLEVSNYLFVLQNGSLVSLLIHFEIEPVFLEHLHRGLFGQRVQDFVDLSFPSSEDFEFFGKDDIIVLGNLFHKSF